MHVVTESDPASGALFARNPYNTEFPRPRRLLRRRRDAGAQHRPATAANSSAATAPCARSGGHGPRAALRPDRRRAGSLRRDAGADSSCADGESSEVVFRLGAGPRRRATPAALVQRFRGGGAAPRRWRTCREHWQRRSARCRWNTPDPALDVLANGWLLYQTIACRLWARSGYYQSGGAFGFRDQLQDAMALLHAAPELAARAPAAVRRAQFPEGDVQHWWHPPPDAACARMFRRLPVAAAGHRAATCCATGDTGVLDEQSRFIEGRPVHHGRGVLLRPAAAFRSRSKRCTNTACARSSTACASAQPRPAADGHRRLERRHEPRRRGRARRKRVAGLLPVRGADALRRRGAAARRRRTSPNAARPKPATLRAALERHAWDGEWYRRAYFDDGTPLGSAGNAECRIDSIAQSWSVLSGAGAPERAAAGDGLARRSIWSRRDAR